MSKHSAKLDPCMDHNASNSAMSITIQNIQIAFEELGYIVDIVLCMQLGDAVRLNEQKWLCLLFLGNIREVCFQFFSSFYIHLYVYASISHLYPQSTAKSSQPAYSK